MRKNLIRYFNAPINGEKGLADSSFVDCSLKSLAETSVLWSDFRFRREEHLKGRNKIREVFGKGKQYGCKGAKLFVLKNDLPHNRICFTFSRFSSGKQIPKKNQTSEKSHTVWNAVARNHARRLGREAYRLLRPNLFGCHDLILLVYPETELKKNMTLSDRSGQLEFLFSRAGLIK